jgi:outer membrane cobalamin receptor
MGVYGKRGTTRTRNGAIVAKGLPDSMRKGKVSSVDESWEEEGCGQANENEPKIVDKTIGGSEIDASKESTELEHIDNQRQAKQRKEEREVCQYIAGLTDTYYHDEFKAAIADGLDLDDAMMNAVSDYCYVNNLSLYDVACAPDIEGKIQNAFDETFEKASNEISIALSEE